MNPSTVQLVASYEEAGMTPEEIAQVDGLEVGAVKAILFAHSRKYAERVKGSAKADNLATDETVEDFKKADDELALQVIRRIAQFSEDDGTALKAAMYIRNDRKGRLNPQKAAGQLVQNNILLLNEKFAEAAAALASKVLPAKQLQNENAINV